MSWLLLTTIDVTRNDEFGSAGSVPVVNSSRLFCPSPSGSQVAQDELFVVLPSPPKNSARQASGTPSLTVLKVGLKISNRAFTVPPVLMKWAQELKIENLSTVNVPPLIVNVPVSTSSVALPAALVTNRLPPVMLSVPVAVQPELPTFRVDEMEVTPPAIVNVPAGPENCATLTPVALKVPLETVNRPTPTLPI